MKDETKEINFSEMLFNRDERLLDYIINLQEENERLNNIIDELEKWLKEEQALYGINQQGFSWGVAGDCLDKLKELKESK